MESELSLPRSVHLQTTTAHIKDAPKVSAHIMPFSINYNGSAPVHTYFVLHPAQDSGAHVTADPCKTFNDETCTAAISSFRGRHIHGVRQKLPFGYELGFFRMSREVMKSPSNPSQRSNMTGLLSQRMPKVPKKFSLDDDDDDNFADDDCTGDHYQTLLPSESLFSENVDDEDSEPASIHSLNPVYHAGTSFWIWGPDGPLDQGGDPYMRTWNEWIQVVAPAVRHKLNNITLTQQIHDI